jgi:hypothetical protein
MTRITAFVTASAVLWLSISAGATLIEVDLAASGDGLITRDTDTGLDWLDLNLTLNLSYDEVAADIGVGLPAGFRYATESEVIALFAGAGVPVPSISDSTAYTNAIALMDLLGCTGFLCDTSTEFITGTMELDAFDPLNSVTLQVLINHTQSNVNATMLLPSPKDSATGEAGNFLVRAIPEPGTAALLGGGLLCLAAARRRRSMIYER